MLDRLPSAAWAPPAPRRLLRLPANAGLLVCAVLVLGVSGGLLWTLGINYDGLTGSPVQKLHPATYLAAILFGLAMLRAGNPVAHGARSCARHPASVALLVASLAYFLNIVLRGAPGMAGALDTFLLPALVTILIVDADEETLRRLEWLTHAVMTANAVLGLVEFATGQRFFPYRLDGAIFETDTRSAALQGHPLGNATLTACYVLALLSGGGRLPDSVRIGFVLLQSAALVTFGGRSGIVITLLLGGGRVGLLLFRALVRNRISLPAAMLAAFALPLVPLAVAGLVAGGFFDSLAGRFAADGGSANARVEMFALFDRIPLRDLIIGPDTALVETLRRMNGLEWGIENPIIRTLLYQGAVVTVVLTVTTALFLREVAHRCRPGIALPMIAFLILINTFESLGGKTTLLAKFAILLLALYRPLPRWERGR
ncbi:VpsF family polysaccharide biosynthesis protein [Methylobacterium aerolatum]|uniref:Uncharacterized protein n=1 Tax=Methylobacterium aerolatum TaxID=418708 RepID=A0ABU0I233_9HYPH|nr:VpsF family polysaccharide biosynthesis protein [Methylobacterium aerolatum]MDQ0448093.1 hypothetical protein [Methylobacterium aerolatum]GJD35763.1 hypothetical protein FMGBMHLM_2675 [Methylobacterium aerolatum]